MWNHFMSSLKFSLLAFLEWHVCTHQVKNRLANISKCTGTHLDLIWLVDDHSSRRFYFTFIIEPLLQSSDNFLYHKIYEKSNHRWPAQNGICICTAINICCLKMMAKNILKFFHAQNYFLWRILPKITNSVMKMTFFAHRGISIIFLWCMHIG